MKNNSLNVDHWKETLLALRVSSLIQTQKEMSVKLVSGGLSKVAPGVARLPN